MNVSVGLMEGLPSVEVELTGTFVDSAGVALGSGRHLFDSELTLDARRPFVVRARVRRRHDRHRLPLGADGTAGLPRRPPHPAASRRPDGRQRPPARGLRGERHLLGDERLVPRRAPEGARRHLAELAQGPVGGRSRADGPRRARRDPPLVRPRSAPGLRGLRRRPLPAIPGDHEGPLAGRCRCRPRDRCSEMLLFGGAICDARYSKCCGGLTERYATAWDDREIPYLVSFPDGPAQPAPDDLEAFIRCNPAAFCNTADAGTPRPHPPGLRPGDARLLPLEACCTRRTSWAPLIRSRLGVDLGSRPRPRRRSLAAPPDVSTACGSRASAARSSSARSWRSGGLSPVRISTARRSSWIATRPADSS